MSLSDLSCRILVVAASLDHALTFIQRIRGKAADELTTEATALSELVKIPWTIANKYYSADVHFAAHTVHGLSPHLVQGVPAVVFVWPSGEAYQDHVERLAQDMQGHEPEVSLAVKIHAESSTTTNGEEEEEGELDEFMSSHGFEYVNVTDDDGSLLLDGIPDFPRVIDALSTIMWPSMQAKVDSTHKEHAYMFNWVQTSRDGEHMDEDEVVEMTELARWLEKSSVGSQSCEDPWKAVMCESPTLIDGEGRTEVKMGFEDDFTAFVAAPESGWSTPDGGRLELQDDYASLGSDFESDDDLPTRAEVEAARARIFGGVRRVDDVEGVLGRLEEMKAEISALEDEEERRRAAATVAVGVAYGL
ncbi:hypothetical protein AX15_002246 [Amanita polypyramis BW_CC]|nr:hypothetical protein AX15_002246 [Amanita polypyramis BW_CC]